MLMAFEKNLVEEYNRLLHTAGAVSTLQDTSLSDIKRAIRILENGLGRNYLNGLAVMGHE